MYHMEKARDREKRLASDSSASSGDRTADA